MLSESVFKKDRANILVTNRTRNDRVALLALVDPHSTGEGLAPYVSLKIDETAFWTVNFYEAAAQNPH